jgi:hypothetical protein
LLIKLQGPSGAYMASLHVMRLFSCSKTIATPHYKKTQSESTQNQQFFADFNIFGKITTKLRDLCYSNQHSEHLSIGFNRFGKTTAK